MQGIEVGEKAPDALIYEGHDLKVTSLVVSTAGGQSIATANIAAATVETLPASRAPGIVVALVGLLVGGACLTSGGESQAVGLLFGGVALALGLAMAVLAHERYIVRVELLGGKGRQALGTQDQEEAKQAAEAINRAALWARGRGMPSSTG